MTQQISINTNAPSKILAYFVFKSRDREFNTEMNKIFAQYNPRSLLEFTEIKQISQISSANTLKQLLLVSHSNVEDVSKNMNGLRQSHPNLVPILFKSSSEYNNISINPFSASVFDKEVYSAEQISPIIDNLLTKLSHHQADPRHVQTPAFRAPAQDVWRETDLDRSPRNQGINNNNNINNRITENRQNVFVNSRSASGEPGESGLFRVNSNSSGKYRIRLESVKRINPKSNIQGSAEPKLFSYRAQADPRISQTLNNMQIPYTNINNLQSAGNSQDKMYVVGNYTLRHDLISNANYNSRIRIVLLGDEQLRPDAIVAHPAVDLATNNPQSLKQFLLGAGFKQSAQKISQLSSSKNVSPAIKPSGLKSMKQIKAVTFDRQPASAPVGNEDYFGKTGTQQSIYNGSISQSRIKSTTNIFAVLENLQKEQAKEGSGTSRYAFEWNVKKNVGKRTYVTYLSSQEDRFIRGSFFNLQSRSDLKSKKDVNSLVKERSTVREPSINLTNNLAEEPQQVQQRKPGSKQPSLILQQQSSSSALQKKSKVKSPPQSTFVTTEWEVIPYGQKFMTLSRENYLNGKYQEQAMKISSNRILKNFGSSPRELKQVPKRKAIELGTSSTPSDVSQLTINSVIPENKAPLQRQKPAQVIVKIPQDANQYNKSLLSQAELSKATQGHNHNNNNLASNISSSNNINNFSFRGDSVQPGPKTSEVQAKNNNAVSAAQENKYAKEWEVRRVAGQNTWTISDQQKSFLNKMLQVEKARILECLDEQSSKSPSPAQPSSSQAMNQPIHYTQSHTTFVDHAAKARNQTITSFTTPLGKDSALAEQAVARNSKFVWEVTRIPGTKGGFRTILKQNPHTTSIARLPVPVEVNIPTAPQIPTPSAFKETASNFNKNDRSPPAKPAAIQQPNNPVAPVNPKTISTKYDAQWQVRKTPKGDVYQTINIVQTGKFPNLGKSLDLDTIIQNNLKIRENDTQFVAPKPVVPTSLPPLPPALPTSQISNPWASPHKRTSVKKKEEEDTPANQTKQVLIIQNKPIKEPIVQISRKQKEYNVLVNLGLQTQQELFSEDQQHLNKPRRNNNNISTDEPNNAKDVYYPVQHASHKEVIVVTRKDLEPNYKLELGEHFFNFQPQISPIQREINDLSIDTVVIENTPPNPALEIISVTNKQTNQPLVPLKKDDHVAVSPKIEPIDYTIQLSNRRQNHVQIELKPSDKPQAQTKTAEKRKPQNQPISTQPSIQKTEQITVNANEARTYHVTPTVIHRTNHHIQEITHPSKTAYVASTNQVRTLGPLTDLTGYQMRIQNGVRVYSLKKRGVSPSPTHTYANVVQHTRQNQVFVPQNTRVVYQQQPSQHMHPVAATTTTTYVRPVTFDIADASAAIFNNEYRQAVPSSVTANITQNMAVVQRQPVPVPQKASFHLSEINNIIEANPRPQTISQRYLTLQSQQLNRIRHPQILVRPPVVPPRDTHVNMHSLLGSVQSIDINKNGHYVESIQSRRSIYFDSNIPAANTQSVSSHILSIVPAQKVFSQPGASSSLNYELASSEPINILYLIPTTRNHLFAELSKLASVQDKLQSYRTNQELVLEKFRDYNLAYVFPIDEYANDPSKALQAAPDNTYVIRFSTSPANRRDIHLNSIQELPELSKELCREKPKSIFVNNQHGVPKRLPTVQVLMKKLNRTIQTAGSTLRENTTNAVVETKWYYTASELKSLRQGLNPQHMVILVADEVPESIQEFLMLPYFECVVVPGGKHFKAQQARYPRFEWILVDQPKEVVEGISAVINRLKARELLIQGYQSISS